MAKKKQPAASAANEANRPYNLAGRQADDQGLEDRLFVRMPPLMLAEIKMLADIEGRPVANMARHLIEVGLRQRRELHEAELKPRMDNYIRSMRVLERK
jgi:hypothetical protein